MARTNFERLRIYKLSEDLADEIWEVVSRWRVFARDTLGKQLVRSSDSIGGNIAEGIGRGTYKDCRQFVRIARGSLYETKHGLRRAFRRKLIDQTCVVRIKPMVDELVPKLNGYLRYLGTAIAREGRARSSTNNHQLTTNNNRKRSSLRNPQ